MARYLMRVDVTWATDGDRVHLDRNKRVVRAVSRKHAVSKARQWARQQPNYREQERAGRRVHVEVALLQPEEATAFPNCPTCGGPPVFLGTLGAVEHWRCRYCGITFDTGSPT